MTPTKLLIGQILVAFAIVALGFWTATQWAASILADQSEVGPPRFEFGWLSLCQPWSAFSWWFIGAYARTDWIGEGGTTPGARRGASTPPFEGSLAAPHRRQSQDRL